MGGVRGIYGLKNVFIIILWHKSVVTGGNSEWML